MVGPMVTRAEALKRYRGKYPKLYYTIRKKQIPLGKLPASKLVSHRGSGYFCTRNFKQDEGRSAGPAGDHIGGMHNPYGHSGDIYITRRSVPTSGYMIRYMDRDEKKVKVRKSLRGGKPVRQHRRRKAVRR